jgi:hypothetical protein
MSELSNLQQKSMQLLSRTQLIAFGSAAIGIAAIYGIISFVRPGLTSLIVLMAAVFMSVSGILILIELWWFTSIKKTLLQSTRLMRLILLNCIVILTLISGWLLYLNSILNWFVLASLCIVLYTYYQFNRSWGITIQPNKTIPKRQQR